MISPDVLAARIRKIGFSCTACGTCCRTDATDPGYVMVSCGEVRAIMAATGLPWDRIVEPYPEALDDGDGRRYTLGWCVRRDGTACRFLEAGRCSVYADRPWICRTYPFMLDGDELTVSACEGLGRPVSFAAALQIAHDLILRRAAEEEDAARIKTVLATAPRPAGPFIVIDSEGMKVTDG
jgi:hypothetical protein